MPFLTKHMKTQLMILSWLNFNAYSGLHNAHIYIILYYFILYLLYVIIYLLYIIYINPQTTLWKSGPELNQHSLAHQSGWMVHWHRFHFFIPVLTKLVTTVVNTGLFFSLAQPWSHFFFCFGGLNFELLTTLPPPIDLTTYLSTYLPTYNFIFLWFFSSPLPRITYLRINKNRRPHKNRSLIIFKFSLEEKCRFITSGRFEFK